MFKKRKDIIIKDKNSVYIDKSVKIGKNVIIYENNRIEGNTIIGDNVILFPNNYILNAKIENNVEISSSHIVNSEIKDNCKIGPFARLRPNTILGENVKVGNFVEIKNAKIGKDTKISHLAYVGDAVVGERCNVGCGVIFVNYNGRIKQTTNIGNNCFIGSNCNIIAPVDIESNSYICAGTTVTEKVNTKDFVIGRVRQTNKPNRAQHYLKGEK